MCLSIKLVLANQGVHHFIAKHLKMSFPPLLFLSHIQIKHLIGDVVELTFCQFRKMTVQRTKNVKNNNKKRVDFLKILIFSNAYILKFFQSAKDHARIQQDIQY